MKNIFTRFLFISGILLAAGSSPGLGQTVNDDIITLDEFIERACVQDTVFQEILIDELTLQYQKALQLPARDIILEVTSQYNFWLDTDDEDPEHTVALSKLFPYTGTQLSADYTASFSGTSHTKESEFNLRISQPLAENALGKTTRLLDKIIGLETDIARYQIVEAYEDYLARLIQVYYNWYAAYENFKTGQAAYEKNMQLFDSIKERQKSNIALPIDVNKIAVQVLAKEENLIALRSDYQQDCNLIRTALRYDGSCRLIPESPHRYQDVTVDVAKDFAVFRDESRTSVILRTLEDKSSLEVDKQANELLPSIRLFAGYSAEGDEFDLQHETEKAAIGISLEWPFPAQVEKAALNIAKINRDKTTLGSANTYLRLYDSLQNLSEQIAQEAQLIGLADRKIELAAAIVKDEAENYSYGKVSLKDLIDEANRLEDAKFSKISHEVQLKRLTVEWLRLTDRLIKQHEIIRR